MLFLTLTTLHLESNFLMSIHIELLTLVIVLISILHSLYIKKINFLSPVILFPLVICLFFGITPLISSFFNSDMFNIINDDEYKSLIETLIITPFIYLYLKHSSNLTKDEIAKIYVIFLSILGIYFFYRYLVLNEVREYDLRPKLKIKHGDPNFLCTLFSIGIPLSLKMARDYYKSKKITGTITFLIISTFLIICCFATQSRMGILALLIGLIYLFSKRFWNYSKKSLFIGFAIITIISSFIIFSGSLDRFQKINDKSNNDRIMTYKNGLKIISESPFIGAGMHNSKNTFYKNTQYPNFQSEFSPLDIHNTFLKAFAELGILGFLFFSIIILYCWPKGKKNKTDLYFLKSSFFILLISCLTIGITYKDFLYFHIFILAGLVDNNVNENDRLLT